MLAVCAGFQVVGRSFPDAEGRSCEGLGLLDVVTTKGHGRRCVGEVVSLPEHATLALVTQRAMTGFENHSGVTQLGAGTQPLGRVRFGVGNGDGAGTEGATSGQRGRDVHARTGSRAQPGSCRRALVAGHGQASAGTRRR